jgi:group I intron endonuclease
MRRIQKPGIYEIKNIANGKMYIGSSKDIVNRFSQHKANLRNNKHTNTHLQASWNKHGGSNFIFRTVELIPNPTKQILEEREDYWIAYYDSINKGYNMQGAVQGSFSREWHDRNRERVIKNKFYHEIEYQSFIETFIESKVQEGLIFKKRTNFKEKVRLTFENIYSITYFIDSNKTIAEQFNSSKCRDRVLEICPTTKQILFTYNTLKEILIKYTDIKRGLMEQILYGKNNKRSASGRIFIQESEYLQNPDILKTLVVGKPLKIVVKIDMSKLPEIVILEHYSSAKEILSILPLNPNSLITVLSKNKPTITYPYIYA